MGLVLCDRCGVRAAHRFTKSEAIELAFCGHHANKHRESLSVQGFIEVASEVEAVLV